MPVKPEITHNADMKALGEAEKAIQQTLKSNPENYDAWVRLAKIQYDLRQYETAIVSTERSEAFDPYISQFEKIQQAMQIGATDRAGDIATNILSDYPGHSRAVFTLAHIYRLKSEFELQVDILRQGLNINPANITLRQMMVGAYEDCGRYHNAIETSKHLVQLNASYMNLFALMRIYMRYGFNEEVVQISCKAMNAALNELPKQYEVNLLKGHALRILGRRDEALAAYKSCTKDMPQNGTAWWALADMKTYQFSQQEHQSLKSSTSGPDVNPWQRCPALFAFAKAVEDEAGMDSAMGLYSQANASHPTANFDADRFGKAVESLIQAFDPETLSRQSPIIADDLTPIFIVGLPRSGSTLIEQILASHSQIEGTMELPTLPGTKRKIHSICASQFGGSYLQKLSEIPARDLESFGRAYLDESAFFRKESVPYFTDKLPHNFEHVGLIHKILPQAKIIDVRRHPMDCGLSVFKQYFSRGVDYSYDLTDIGAYYKGYLRIMDHWDMVLPGKVFRLQYEHLVLDAERQIWRLLDFIGLGFEKACLNFHDNKRAVRTASSEQVRRPLDKSGIGGWRSVESQLAPLKNSLGAAAIDRAEKDIAATTLATK